MQSVVSASPQVIERPPLTIRLETVAYVALITLALVLRLANLGGVPITEGETRQALAAFRAVVPESSGETIIPTSPIMFAVQAVSFGVMGGSEFAARFLTALGGSLLVLLPLLFRKELGGTRTLIVALLLLLSPVALVGARLSAPAIWSLLFAVMMLWALLRYRENQSNQEVAVPYQVVAAVSGAGLIFLSEPGGIVLGLILAGAALVTIIWMRLARSSEFDDLDEEEKALSDTPRDALSQWGMPVFVGALFIILVGTGVLLYPAGLSAIGEVFAGFVRGFSEAQVGSVQPFALVISLFYEPFNWLLGIVGIVILVNRRALTVIDRFLVAWLFVALAASLVYVGTDSYHALWFTIPLIGLVSAAVLEMLAPTRPNDVFAAPPRARWIIALAAIAVIAVFTVSAQGLARSLLTSSSSLLMSVSPNANSVVLVIVAILFMIIGYFLVASVWGNRTSLQGVGLGVLIFGALTSFGSGWNAVYSDIANPQEPYHLRAISLDVTLLRETLHELAGRNSGGFNAMPLTVLAPEDGVIAWLVRDFSRTEFITDLREAVGEPIVLLPNYEEAPVLGASYVGQDFITLRTWTPTVIYAIDYPAWWMQRHARFAWLTLETHVLWLRTDVYQGTIIEEAAG